MIRRLYWRALRAVGLRRASWDAQFRAGAWDTQSRSSNTVLMVRELCRGRLVEFGCGVGLLLEALPDLDYVGYDISRVAVERAAKRFPQGKFVHMDMADWPGEPASLILLEECLYYLRDPRPFLRRCLANGTVLVIVHDAKKHAGTLRACREVANCEETVIGSRAYLVLRERDES